MSKYCDRCGEEPNFTYECDICGNEFCEDCATGDEVVSGVCKSCQDFTADVTTAKLAD